MSQLARHIVAEIRRMGKRYGHLEALLPGMTEPQLRDLLNLIRDTRDGENRRMQGQARRMGLPPGALR